MLLFVSRLILSIDSGCCVNGHCRARQSVPAGEPPAAAPPRPLTVPLFSRSTVCHVAQPICARAAPRQPPERERRPAVPAAAPARDAPRGPLD